MEQSQLLATSGASLLGMWYQLLLPCLSTRWTPGLGRGWRWWPVSCPHPGSWLLPFSY